MPGDYTEVEIERMPAHQLIAAQARGWKKEEQQDISLGTSVPQPSANVWAANRTAADGGEDFVTPSGQKCLLRRLTPEMLLGEGILDQVTRLEGLAQELVDNAEGLPPEKQKLPNREELSSLLELLSVIVPLAVVEPKVYRDGTQPEDQTDAILVSHIDLMDRVAIMTKALAGVQALSSFRNPG